MWWILLIILGVWFLSVMIWIMFAKITLEINTVDNCYEIRIWGGIKAGYRLSTHEFYVSWGRFEKRVTIHSLKKQKKNPNKNVTPIKENKKPKQFEKLYHFPNLYPLFKIMRVRHFHIWIDTDDYVWNAWIAALGGMLRGFYPVQLWVNYEGREELVYIADTSVWRILGITFKLYRNLKVAFQP